MGWFLRAPHPLEKLPIFLRLSHSFALSLSPKVFLSAILIEWCDKSSPLYTHRMRPPVVWARTSSSLFSLYILLQWAFQCARERARKSSVFTLWVCRVAARGAWAHSTYRPTYTQMYAITVRQRNGGRVWEQDIHIRKRSERSGGMVLQIGVHAVRQRVVRICDFVRNTMAGTNYVIKASACTIM